MTAVRPAPSARAGAVTALLFVLLTVTVGFGARWLDGHVDGPVSSAVRRALAGRTALLDVLRVLTWFGHPLVVDGIVLLGAALLWRSRRPVEAVSLVLTGVASLLVRELVKTLLDRPRPPAGFSVATGGSYPSGHTAGAAFVAVAAVVLVGRAWVVVAATAYAPVIAASRVLLDVHWLSDVVGGLLLGATFGLLVPSVPTRGGRRRPIPSRKPVAEP